MAVKHLNLKIICFLMSKKSSVRGYYSTCTTKLTTLRSKHSQSALEYMMTYGWAILIIVIVAAGLYSLGIFSPTNSASTSITGFSGLSVTQTACVNAVNNQILELYVSNTIGYAVNVTKINVTGSSNGVSLYQNVSSILNAGQSGIFYVNGACNKSSSTYSGSVTITYTEPGQTFSGPYFSSGTVSKTPSGSNQDLVAAFDPTGPQTPNSYIVVSSYQPLSMKTFSYGAWFYITYNLTNNCCSRILATTAQDGGTIELSSNEDSETSSGTQIDGYDTGGWLGAGPNYPYKTWEYILGVYNGTGYNVYLNGQLIWSHTESLSGATSGSFLMGTGSTTCSGGTGCQFWGYISNVQAYSTVLSSQQAIKLYNEGLNGAPLSEAGLIGWWPLDGNANDYGGNNNNGVATNVQWVSP